MYEKEQLWSLHFGSNYSPILSSAVEYEVPFPPRILCGTDVYFRSKVPARKAEDGE